MRFRASITNVQTFFRIVQAIEKLQKRCLIKFTEEHMCIICNNDANEGGIQVWSKIKVEALFENYRIQSNANNEITMALAGEALLGALKSASSSVPSTSAGSGAGGGLGGALDAEEIVMKLAKKNDQALLSFEIKGMSRTGQQVRVVHDVKIEVMKPADVDKMQEPLCPKADLLILLPSLLKVRTIVERMKQMSDVMAFQANNNKRLVLSLRTDSVTIETEWKDCQNPAVAEPESEDDDDDEDEGRRNPPDPDKMFTVLISTRSFLKFLNSHVVSTTTIASVCQHHCVILYVYIGDVADAGGVLTFYIPAIIDDEGR
ncbi:Checkpoint protein hus1 [Psilocybe cubensis]|uniref:Checkpoint protein hus1 n=1 Tax=Psilocybe cubensis TaxID=181762 RepID=A0ACB8H2L0_PSICU|nr:Checkpoint protein hus1 [Psilocybe cubensis]KAH9481907.1 Checkpoint protein hus1 [Psilocybe cubensis]